MSIIIINLINFNVNLNELLLQVYMRSSDSASLKSMHKYSDEKVDFTHVVITRYMDSVILGLFTMVWLLAGPENTLLWGMSCALWKV
jgi:hypothetical protein